MKKRARIQLKSINSQSDISNASTKNIEKKQRVMAASGEDSMNLSLNDVMPHESTKMEIISEFQRLNAITEPTTADLCKGLLASLQQSLNLEITVNRVLNEHNNNNTRFTCHSMK